MTEKRTLELGQKGTVLWGFNHFRKRGLTGLLNDLLVAGKTGFDKPNCDPIKLSIGFALHETTELGDGTIFCHPLWKHFDKFEKVYYSWNDKFEENRFGHEAIQHRKKMLRKLRKTRNNISKAARKNGHIIENNLDLKLIDDIYDSLGNIVKSGPELFNNLAKAIADFDKNKITN